MPQSRQKTHTSEKRIRAPIAAGSAPCAPCCDMCLSPHGATVSPCLSIGYKGAATCATCSGHFYICSFFSLFAPPPPSFFCALEYTRNMTHMTQRPVSRCKSASCAATCQAPNMTHMTHMTHKAQGVPFILSVESKPRNLRGRPLPPTLASCFFSSSLCSPNGYLCPCVFAIGLRGHTSHERKATSSGLSYKRYPMRAGW
jgi:hypothetical protein